VFGTPDSTTDPTSIYYYSRSTYLKDPYYPTTDGPEIAINILDDYEDEEEP
jgi:hypothetical protein